MNWKYFLPLVFGLHAAHAYAGSVDQLGVDLRVNDNLTRAELGYDIKSDTALAVSAAGTAWRLPGASDIALNFTLAGAAYRRYHGLDSLDAGLDLTYRRKFGLGPHVPQLHLTGSATRLEQRDAARDGWLYGAEIGLAKRLSYRSSLRMDFRLERRRADTVGERLLPWLAADVFDLRSRSLGFGADHAVHSGYVLSGGYRAHDGDIVSSTLRNLPIFLASDAIAADPAFGADVFAYKMKAMTHVASLGISRIIGPQASFTVGYERAYSRTRNGIEYSSNLIRATLLYQL